VPIALAALVAAVLGFAAPPAAAQSGVPQNARASGAITPEYVVGPGDKLRIEVYKDPQLSQSLQVRPDGKITLPLVGDVEAVGLTPMALRDTIAASLKEYMTNPVVTVIVVEASAATAYVVGEVNQPGAVTLQGGQLTVLQALALAGGLKDFADSKNIRILRPSITGVETIAFNYKDAIRGVEVLYLRPGDTVVVPD
jgi:polysaccharide export outer membrane protein